MLESYTKFYKSFRSKERPDYKTIEDSYKSGKLCLSWEFKKLGLKTRILLDQLEPHIPAICQVCRCLSMYHLAMILVELGDGVPNWTHAIVSEMQKRIGTFNWITAMVEPQRFNMPKQSPCIIDCSRNVFSTRIDSALTFFDSKVAEKVQYLIPELGFGQTKSFVDFLKHDATFDLDVPNIILGMDNLKFNEQVIASNMPCMKASVYSTLCFPPISGINVRYFTSASDITEIVKADKQIECLLLFVSSDEPIDQVNALMSALAEVQTTQIPIGGSFCINKTFRMNFEGSENANYVAFVRDKNSKTNFFAASAVIPQRDNHFFEAKVKEFQGNLKRHQQEFLLSFVCCGRKRKSSESKILCKQFNCPVFQMDVNGELGQDCYTPAHREPAGYLVKKTREDVKYIHAFTYVLVYISWGNPVSPEGNNVRDSTRLT